MSSVFIGRFSKGGLHAVYISGSEPRITKQYKCHHGCNGKNYRERGWRMEKKVSLRSFLADLKIASPWGEKMRFGGIL